MTHTEMVAIAHRGLLSGPSPMLRHHPAGRRAEVEGMVMKCWGPAGRDLNKVAVVGPSPNLARIVELANEFFGPESNGYGIVVEADAGHPVETELRDCGWQVFEDEAALVLPVIPSAPPLTHGLEIGRVGDAEGRRDLMRVMAAGFGAPTSEGGTELSPDAFESFTPSVECALDPDVALLVGYVDSNPVSSAIAFVVGPIVGITGVATVPAYRRRGLATALTRQAIDAGAARSCTSATLAALGASYDLYRKMGFVHVCNHRAYAPPEGRSSMS